MCLWAPVMGSLSASYGLLSAATNFFKFSFAQVASFCDRIAEETVHRADDLLPFVGLTPDQDKLYTNEEFYWATGPDSPALTYVYNSVAYWPGCTGGTMNVSSPTGGRRR